MKPKPKARPQKEHRLLLKEYRQHQSRSLPPHYQVQAQAPLRTPPMTQPKTPPKPQAEVEIKLTQYVKDYRAAGKVWLDTVVQEKEKAYNTLYDRLQQLGTPHKEGLDQADRQQVYNCIKDRTGMFLSQDENVLYIETEEEFEKTRIQIHRQGQRSTQKLLRRGT